MENLRIAYIALGIASLSLMVTFYVGRRAKRLRGRFELSQKQAACDHHYEAMSIVSYCGPAYRVKAICSWCGKEKKSRVSQNKELAAANVTLRKFLSEAD